MYVYVTCVSHTLRLVDISELDSFRSLALTGRLLLETLEEWASCCLRDSRAWDRISTISRGLKKNFNWAAHTGAGPSHRHYIVTPDNQLRALTNLCSAVNELAKYIRNPVCDSPRRDDIEPQHLPEVPKKSRREQKNEYNKRKYHKMKQEAQKRETAGFGLDKCQKEERKREFGKVLCYKEHEEKWQYFFNCEAPLRFKLSLYAI